MGGGDQMKGKEGPFSMADTRVAAVTLCFNEETMSRRQHSGLGLRRCSSDRGQEDILGRQSAHPDPESGRTG